jgi:hypothetical protein
VKKHCLLWTMLWRLRQGSLRTPDEKAESPNLSDHYSDLSASRISVGKLLEAAKVAAAKQLYDLTRG